MRLSASTRLFGIIADPIYHLSAHERFAHLFAEWQFDGLMLPFHVRAENLAKFVAGLRNVENLSGFLVTVPHKVSAVALVDRLSARARLVGAVNVVAREADGSLRGDILDGIGFVEGLAQAGHRMKDKRVYVAGAGGVASAICFAVLEGGAAELTVFNRTRAKAERLVERLRAAFPACRVRAGDHSPAGHDVVINATSVGLDPNDAPPFDMSALEPEMLAAEVIMNPQETQFLKHALMRGCAIHYGEMMVSTQLVYLARYMGACDRRLVGGSQAEEGF